MRTVTHHAHEPDIRAILTENRTIAVVGCSTDPAKEAHTVPAYMQAAGYRIIPVNPRADAILGEKAYPSLRDVPDDYGIVNLFRPSDQVGPFVDEAIRVGKAKVIWMQLGIRNDEAAARAREAGMTVVMDRCLRVEHRRHLR